ncbi:MAG: hypothetical protein D4R65_06030 [Verrucomicrobiaceae bacterium]|nr:MAG: hypothetical protein D4R65_06030 [Verrucomicrobiaceae bacterium]
MQINWIFSIAGLLVVGFLVWLLMPSAAYKIARKWLHDHDYSHYKHWTNYTFFKSFLTERSIIMNAINSPSFTQDDLDRLNELIGKFDKPTPPANAIKSSVGVPYDSNRMTWPNDTDKVNRSLCDFVLHSRVMGVEWRGDILKKEVVIACSADRLLLNNIERETAENPLATDFLSFFEASGQIVPDFFLQPSAVQGFLDLSGSKHRPEELFKLLAQHHPFSDFSVVLPRLQGRYDADTMTSSDGAQAWPKSIVIAVVQPGLVRTRSPQWRVKALVRIETPSRYER